jgi:hypothetical protein
MLVDHEKMAGQKKKTWRARRNMPGQKSAGSPKNWQDRKASSPKKSIQTKSGRPEKILQTNEKVAGLIKVGRQKISGQKQCDRPEKKLEG